MSKEHSQSERLNKVVEPFRRAKVEGLDPAVFSAFDTTKPNFHDSKTEFLEEKELVETAISNATHLFIFLLSGVWDTSEKTIAAQRVVSNVEGQSRSRLKNHLVKDTCDMARKSASEIGLPRVTAHLLHDLRVELRERKQELEGQQRVYWSGKSRPPNHYARTIALRFARFIAGETGEKPTVGTSRDGGHPSTDYGRALEEIYEILGIKSNFRRAGEWAISQLTDEDFGRPKNIHAELWDLDEKEELNMQNMLK